MANYSCTTFGCMTAATGYSTLIECNNNCVGWGCPSSVASDADLYFVYDSSLSFSDDQRELARAQVTIYLAGLTSNGWTGHYHHIYANLTWLDSPRAVYYHNANITADPGPTGGNTGLGYDNNFTGTAALPSAQLLGKNIVVVVFTNEASSYHDSVWSLNGWSPSWWGNHAVVPNNVFDLDRQDYESIYDLVTISSSSNNFLPGTLNAVLIPVTATDGSQTQAEINFAVHSIATIDSGNQDITGMGGSGALDGTWIDETSPRLLGLTNGSLPALCEVGDTSVSIQHFGACPACFSTNGDGLEYVNNIYSYYSGLGRPNSLDSIGWFYDPTFGSISSTTLNNLLSGVIGTVSGTSTICLSGASTGSTSPFPYSASAECNLGCFGGACNNPTMSNYDPYANADCVGNAIGSTAYGLAGTYGDESCCWDNPHICTWDGCEQDTSLVTGDIPQFNTLADCETGCTSWDCTSSGCTLFNIPTNSAGSGYLGTGGTYTTSGSCTGTCVSYNCGASGCLEQAGTGGTYSTSATCTASCYSYNCSVTGCEPAIVGSAGTYYDITNHLDALTSCTAACETYDCTDYGCVVNPGSGGAYNTLNLCSAACQSWECVTTGCQAWNSPSYTTAQSYVNAPGGQSGQYGTGGSATFNICTGICETWVCAINGCVTSWMTGWGGATAEADCNDQCVSYSCGTSGCVGPLAGTGGTFNGQYPLTECQDECASYNCDPLAAQPSTALEWSVDSCTQQWGTGGTFYNPISIALSEDDCQTGCTSWSCQNPNVPPPGGCIEYPNTGNTLSQDSWTACTAETACVRYDCTNTGCVVGHILTGTYNDLASCTGACTSYSCTTSGCSYYNETGTTLWTGVGHLGTGGTYDNANCDYVCESWSCTTIGCITQDGTGGTYTVGYPGWDGATAYLCNSECDSWTCTDDGCIQHNITPGTVGYVDGMGGSGGTYSSLALCENTAPCTSWNCDDTDCVVQLGTGGTYTTYNNCTGTCETWNCGDFGCSSQLGSGGTYDSLIECTGGTAVNSYADGCTSFTCTNTGCEIYNEPNYGTGGTFSTSAACSATCVSWNCDNSGCDFQNGTGGTFSTEILCTGTCQSWDCTNIGCITLDGTGGTYTIAADGITAPTCLDICDSWDCTDTGCEGYNIPGSATNYNGQGGSGGAYSSLALCENSAPCTSWNCDDTDCTVQIGTGGTYTTYNNCTGTCQTWNCGDFGCSSQLGSGGTYDSLIECTGGTAANSYLDGCTSWDCGSSSCNLFNAPNYGTGGTYATESICTGFCETYNCTDTGCVVAQGTGGMFPDLVTCTASCESYTCHLNGCLPHPNYGSGGTYTQELFPSTYNLCGNECSSWDCEDDGCIEYNVPGPGGTGGTYYNSYCDNVCISYICEDYGCEPYNFGVGTGGTYTTPALCAVDCKSWDCGPSPTGCFAFNGGDGTGGTYTVQSNCTSACKSYNCQPTGCAEITGNDGGFLSLSPCLLSCTSYDCTVTGCTRYNYTAVLGNPATYTNGSGGTGGMYTTNALCHNDCQSWDCQPTGCEEYNIVGSSNPPGNNNNQGTGGTYTVLGSPNASTCDNTCESWECVYTQLVPPASYNITDACTHHLGTAYVFSSATDCSTGCTSWTCVGLGQNGCTEFPNTASTYTSETECTASTVCAYYDCTIAGCVLRPGEYTGGIDSYLTESACEVACVGWGCIADTLASGTTIYVYYDVSNLTWSNTTSGPFDGIGAIRIDIQDYITTKYPTHVGDIYHTIVSDGNWLDWTNSIYHNEFRVAPATGTTPYHPTNNYDERALHAIGWANALTYAPIMGDWYDQYSANTYINVITSTGVISTITTHGIAPTAHTSGDTLVIALLTEANGVTANTIYDVNGYHSGLIGGGGTIPYMTSQPTTAWTTDYTANTTNYNAVTAATGTLRGLLVPRKSDPGYWSGDSTKMCMLQGLAAIRPGNNVPLDGRYQSGTAPVALGFVGMDYSQIENMNPYWDLTTATYGNLEAKGWGFWQEGGGGSGNMDEWIDDVSSNTTLDQHLQLTTPAVGTCISAETLYTINTTYPHTTEVACSNTCQPQYYSCTTTGCSLSWAGTMSLAQCQSICTSVSCTTSSSVGCEVYNSPGSLSWQNGQYGTGGTFTGANMMSDCQLQCFSYACDPVTNYLTQLGCQQYPGTGQTYVSYNSCTGSCKSWACDDPCVTNTNNVSTGLGCIKYYNTGATHLTLIACTGVCQETWYCTTASTIDSCDGLTWSTITSGYIYDHINKLGSTPSWNNILFQSFKFLYITTPTNATDTCYSGSPANAYWATVNSIEITVSASTIPISQLTYSWDDVIAFMTQHYPLITISTISDIENIGDLTLAYDWELCSCVDVPCTIGCTNSPTIPANTVGPHATYALAETNCCSATTWSCATNTIIDDCDGLTLVPGLFTDAEGCYEWFGSSITTYGLDVTTFKCEVMPSTVLAQCELGPNNGQLIRLTGITSSIAAISSNNYTSLTGYTYALQNLSTPVPNAVNGLPLDILQNEVQLVYASSSVYYGWADCECDNPYSCGCIEMFDGTGPYTSKTECELSCCSATTWNCVGGDWVCVSQGCYMATLYFPICGDKTAQGQTNNITSLLEHYRVNSQTTLFGLDTWAIGTTPQIPWATVQNNMLIAGSPWVWQDCYTLNGDYTPNQYLYTISHPLINGGALYQTWNDFYTAVNAIVGITLSTSDTIDGINTKINTHFVCTAFNVVFDIKSCCSDDDCYCYDTLDSSGYHANELLCDSSCCPSNIMSWSCELDSTSSYGCTYGSYGPPINTTSASNGPWLTLPECEMLSLACATSWECDGVSPNCFCVEVQGHHTVTGHYPTEWDCDNNTNINDCCGLPVTYTCDTGTLSSNMTGLDNGMTAITATTLGFPNLGYLTIDDVLTYVADPTTSPTNQTSAISSFSFCLEELSQITLSNLSSNCKCGDGCNGVLHFGTAFTFSHFNLGSTDTANAFDIINYPTGYCTTWAEFIDQLNIVWAVGQISVNLTQTYQQVVDEVQLAIGVSQFGVGTVSCIDSSIPCGCIPNALGIGVSLADCSSSCCTETLTYTCTHQGCKSRCDGTGEYQTLQECELECWEWRCNQDIWGCTDPFALNYNPLATIDDGTCIMPNDFWTCGIAENCSDKIDTLGGGLSFTTQISAIAANSQSPNNWHLDQFDTLKYGLGGGNNQIGASLPCDPCPVPGQNWGQPGPYYAYIKYVMYSGLGSAQFITWKTFIDAINALGYSFQYGLSPGNLNDRWQDLEAVLGASQLHCVWDWCDCSGARTCVPDTNGNYVTSAQCYSDVLNDCTSWECNSDYVESCSGATTYMGPYTNFGNASNDYVATYPTIDLSAYTFSVATIPLANTAYWASVGIPPCAPPVGPLPVPLSMFPLLTFTGITVNSVSTLASYMTQLTFISWVDLITAINLLGLSGLVVNQGMSIAQLIQEISLAGYNTAPLGGIPLIDFDWGFCMCGYIDCECIEVPDGTGPYKSITCCEGDESDDNCCYYNWDCPTVLQN